MFIKYFKIAIIFVFVHMCIHVCHSVLVEDSSWELGLSFHSVGLGG